MSKIDFKNGDHVLWDATEIGLSKDEPSMIIDQHFGSALFDTPAIREKIKDTVWVPLYRHYNVRIQP